MSKDFAIFICTHGRPNKQLTLNMLLEGGYTGKWYLVLDDTDKTIQQYIDEYGADKVIIFNKNYYINHTETISNKPLYACIVYAKNAVEDIARSMNLDAFIIADDDLQRFRLRYPQGDVLKSYSIRHSMDKLIQDNIDFVLNSDIVATSFCTTSMYCCGVSAFTPDSYQRYRVPYVFVFRNPKHKVEWIADFPEDSVTAYRENRVGHTMLTIPDIQIDSVAPAKRLEGGMTDTYRQDGVRICMRAVIAEPAFIKIGYYKGQFLPMYPRKKSFPKIISGRYKK
jgi:hypothetical protein